MDGGAQVDFAGRKVELLVHLQPLLHDLFVLVLVHVRGEGFVDKPFSLELGKIGRLFDLGAAGRASEASIYW